MHGRTTSTFLTLILLATSPALLGIACEPVDLGGNPDAGPVADTDAGPTPGADAGPAATPDAGGAADAGGGSGAIMLRADGFLIDVFDGVEHALTTSLSVTIDDPSPVAHDVRPQSVELLASDGTVMHRYALDSAPLTRGGGAVQEYHHAEQTAPAVGVPAPATAACGQLRYPNRELRQRARVTVDVDGAPQTIEVWHPDGSGGFPPIRPLVLCHEGLRVERTSRVYTHTAGLWLLRRPDGLYDADMSEDTGGATYVAPDVLSVDPTVSIAAHSAMLWPSRFPTFDVAMETYSRCGAPTSGCTIRNAMERYISGASAPPFDIAGAAPTYWCREPDMGELSLGGAERWPASGSFDGWLCQRGASHTLSGDGIGIARFTGTTTAGPFAAELLVSHSQWQYGDPPLR